MKTFKYKFDDLMNPCLRAIHALGGSGTNSEIEEEVARILSLSENEVNYIHRGNVTKLDYLLRWARNYLKRAGILENSARGVWSLTEKGQKVKEIDPREIVRQVTAIDVARRRRTVKEADSEIQDEAQELSWQDELLKLIKGMPADSFEKLSVPRLEIAELWLLGATKPDQSEWFIAGDLLKSPTIFTFKYPS